MQMQLKPEFEEVLEPLGENAAAFFLAAGLYFAHKVSFAAAAALADLSFNEFLCRLQTDKYRMTQYLKIYRLLR